MILRGLLLASHPAPTVAVTTVVVLLAAATDRPAGWVGGIGLAVLLGQLSVGWSNDALDATRDAQVGRTAKPVVAGLVPARVLLRLAAAAAVAALGVSALVSSLAGVACHALLLGAAWAYNAGLKSTPFSLLAYAVGFGALPGFVTYGLDPGQRPTWWLVTAGALLGVAAGLANAAPDVEDDTRTGVRGAVVRLGARRARLLCALTVVGATAVLVLGGGVSAAAGRPLVALVTVGALTGLTWRGGRHLFTVVLAVVVVDVVLLVVTARETFGQA